MNYLRVCLLFILMAPIALHAGAPQVIEKDKDVQMKMNLTVAYKDSQQDKNKVSVTITFKGDEYIIVNLVNNGNNKTLKSDVKDGMVSISFEIDKKNIEKSILSFTKKSDKRCGYAYVLYLKEYVV